MNEKTKATLTNMDTWKRGLFMVVFSIISGVAKLIVTLVAIFQFVTLLFKGQINKAVLPLGQNLSTYLYQITLFLTFKTDEMPFPFLSFPDGTPSSKLDENNENVETTSETNTKNDVDIVDDQSEDIKDDTSVKKETKNDSLND
ncbi:DUF4389 domain-containing protein [uncultured Paraglaciecola sp.]|jgi:hypothetical protein|uniref:DUF4389 domain-containing protein n=1 Tax=uncultured Paraglaciecola sp. TaxID=1765024 RepID=UPI0025D67C9E|nr:DUF4389 domain-containing protein [uncultured Paraglaciecola sp.]